MMNIQPSTVAAPQQNLTPSQQVSEFITIFRKLRLELAPEYYRRTDDDFQPVLLEPNQVQLDMALINSWRLWLAHKYGNSAASHLFQGTSRISKSQDFYLEFDRAMVSKNFILSQMRHDKGACGQVVSQALIYMHDGLFAADMGQARQILEDYVMTDSATVSESTVTAWILLAEHSILSLKRGQKAKIIDEQLYEFIINNGHTITPQERELAVVTLIEAYALGLTGHDNEHYIANLVPEHVMTPLLRITLLQHGYLASDELEGLAEELDHLVPVNDYAKFLSDADEAKLQAMNHGHLISLMYSNQAGGGNVRARQLARKFLSCQANAIANAEHPCFDQQQYVERLLNHPLEHHSAVNLLFTKIEEPWAGTLIKSTMSKPDYAYRVTIKQEMARHVKKLLLASKGEYPNHAALSMIVNIFCNFYDLVDSRALKAMVEIIYANYLYLRSEVVQTYEQVKTIQASLQHYSVERLIQEVDKLEVVYADFWILHLARYDFSDGAPVVDSADDPKLYGAGQTLSRIIGPELNIKVYDALLNLARHTLSPIELRKLRLTIFYGIAFQSASSSVNAFAKRGLLVDFVCQYFEQMAESKQSIDIETMREIEQMRKILLHKKALLAPEHAVANMYIKIISSLLQLKPSAQLSEFYVKNLCAMIERIVSLSFMAELSQDGMPPNPNVFKLSDTDCSLFVNGSITLLTQLIGQRGSNKPVRTARDIHSLLGVISLYLNEKHLKKAVAVKAANTLVEHYFVDLLFEKAIQSLFTVIAKKDEANDNSTALSQLQQAYEEVKNAAPDKRKVAITALQSRINAQIGTSRKQRRKAKRLAAG